MTTPSRSGPEKREFLVGCKTEDLLDKSACAGALKALPGRLMTWGCGECEQLPIKSSLLDEYQGLAKPAPIKAFEDCSAVAICCGSLTSYALKENNELWSWGCSDNGPLGRPVKGLSQEAWVGVEPPTMKLMEGGAAGKVPERVWGLPKHDKIVKIVAGDSHAGVLTESGDVWLWGHYRDFTGPLGFWNPAKEEVVSYQETPAKIPLQGVALDIASGENHTVILVERGGSRSLVVIGSNEFGQLCTLPSEPPLPEAFGGPANMNQRPAPIVLTPAEITPEKYQDIRHQYLKPHVIPIADLHFSKMTGAEVSSMADVLADARVTKVCAGSATTFLKVVTSSDECFWFSCGRGSCGELGVGFEEQALYQPTLIPVPALCVIDTIVGADFASFALATDGSVWAWGKGELCGLGIEDSNTNVLVPQAIPGLRNKVQALAAGMKTTYAISNEGLVLVWGEGNNYQLGIGHVPDAPALLPTLIPRDTLDDEAVVAVAAGATHAVVITNKHLERRGTKRARSDEPDEVPSVIKRTRNLDSNEVLPQEDLGRVSFQPILHYDESPAPSQAPVAAPTQESSPASTLFDQQSPEKKAPDHTPAFRGHVSKRDLSLAPVAEEMNEDPTPPPPVPATAAGGGGEPPAVEPTAEPSVEAKEEPKVESMAEEACSEPSGEAKEEHHHHHHQVKSATVTRVHKELVTPGTSEVVGSMASESSGKPRDSLTAVLISPERPYESSPVPAPGMKPVEAASSESSMEEEVAREQLNEEQREEEQMAAAVSKAKSKSKAKAKAKTKAKAKAKGRPARKVKAEVEVAGSGEEDSVSDVSKKPGRRPVRAARARAVAEDSVESSDVESGDEETRQPAKRGRGKAKAKASSTRKGKKIE